MQMYGPYVVIKMHNQANVHNVADDDDDDDRHHHHKKKKKGGERIIGEIGSYIRNCSRDLLMCQLAC